MLPLRNTLVSRGGPVSPARNSVGGSRSSELLPTFARRFQPTRQKPAPVLPPWFIQTRDNLHCPVSLSTFRELIDLCVMAIDISPGILLSTFLTAWLLSSNLLHCWISVACVSFPSAMVGLTSGAKCAPSSAKLVNLRRPYVFHCCPRPVKPSEFGKLAWL